MANKPGRACILPHNKKLILWVTSPNGYWMLLSGHWSYATECRRYAMAAGYKLVPYAECIKEIEAQMAERMAEVDGSPFAHDITRPPEKVVN